MRTTSPKVRLRDRSRMCLNRFVAILLFRCHLGPVPPRRRRQLTLIPASFRFPNAPTATRPHSQTTGTGSVHELNQTDPTVLPGLSWVWMTTSLASGSVSPSTGSTPSNELTGRRLFGGRRTIVVTCELRHLPFAECAGTEHWFNSRQGDRFLRCHRFSCSSHDQRPRRKFAHDGLPAPTPPFRFRP
jgi:hypothetical protein